MKRSPDCWILGAPGAPAGLVALATLLLWRAVAPLARLQRPAREA